MTNITSTLTVKLIDDVGGPAKSMAAALKAVEAQVKALGDSGTTGRLQQRMAALGASAGEISKVSAAWKEYAAASQLGATSANWTRAQASAVRTWENSVVSSLRNVRKEEQALLREQERLATKHANAPRGLFGMSGAAGMVGLAAAYKAQQGAKAMLHIYREFDKERRFQKAVMGISDAEQEPLIKQAIHGGATTKFNDIQFIEAQRELAARGLKRDQILGLMDSSANMGMALDLKLPDAVRQMEGALFGFQRDLSTKASAVTAAARTSGMQVKASKVSGMKPEDLTALYKFGATPAFMAGMSEQSLLAFGGVLKKSNIGGDEAGVAFRQLMASAISPTRKGKEAMLAAGLNFKNYQKQPNSLAVQPFVENIAALYGVGLHGASLAGIEKVFGDKELISDPAKFTPALMSVLGKTLGGKDAKSLKSIAGAANRYRDVSMGGVNVEALITDLMGAMASGDRSKAIQLANAFIGPKQGARVVAALGNSDVFKKYREDINDSGDYDKKIAGERMAGFDGSVSKFEGAVKNLETAIGRSFDDGGKGGMLTGAAEAAARFVQGLSEASPHLLRLGSAAAGIAAAWVGAKGMGLLTGGFGLKGSAVALDGSAAALTRAAVSLGAGGAASGAAGAAGAAAAGSKAARLGNIARGALKATLIGGAAAELYSAAWDALPEDVKADALRRTDAINGIKGDGKKSKADTLRDAFNSDRARLGIPAIGDSDVKPQVDNSALHTTMGLLDEIARKLREIGGMNVSPSVTPHIGGIGHASMSPSGPMTKVGSAGDHLRGSFSDYGLDTLG